jgi:vacuolar-type H+-ATPase subunit I/STV1
MKPLSESLNDLSKRTRAAEDAAAAARREGQEKRAAMMTSARSSLDQQLRQFERSAAAAGDTISSRWQQLMSESRDQVDRMRSDLETKRDERRAERLEQNAEASIAFAAWAIDQAVYDVLVAETARDEATPARR